MLGTCLALAVVLPAPAALAATQIGQLDPAAAPGGSCMGAAMFAPMSTAGDPPYAPSGDGVITSWSHKANLQSGRELGLKLLRSQGGGTFAVVGSSALEILEPSTVNTFPTRVPVQAGDRIALWVGNAPTGGPFDPGGGASCAFDAAAGDSLGIGFQGPEPGPGASSGFGGDAFGMRLNVTATVEPDLDGDGHGDESQDGCPTDASTHGACPAAVTDPPPATGTDPPPATGTVPPVTPVPRAWLQVGARPRDSVGDFRVALRVTADRPALLFVRGRIAIGRRPRAFAFRPVRRILRTGAPRTVELKLSQKARRAVRRALRRGTAATARLSIVAVDDANERTAATRSIRLAR